MRKSHILKSEFHLEKWIHKHLSFKNDKEFAIFLVWAMFVALMIHNIG